MPNFIVNKVLFLILVGGRREERWEERREDRCIICLGPTEKISDHRERERERDLFILFFVGNGIQQKAKDQSDFTKLI